MKFTASRSLQHVEHAVMEEEVLARRPLHSVGARRTRPRDVSCCRYMTYLSPCRISCRKFAESEVQTGHLGSPRVHSQPLQTPRIADQKPRAPIEPKNPRVSFVNRRSRVQIPWLAPTISCTCVRWKFAGRSPCGKFAERLFRRRRPASIAPGRHRWPANAAAQRKKEEVDRRPFRPRLGRFSSASLIAIDRTRGVSADRGPIIVCTWGEIVCTTPAIVCARRAIDRTSAAIDRTRLANVDRRCSNDLPRWDHVDRGSDHRSLAGGKGGCPYPLREAFEGFAMTTQMERVAQPIFRAALVLRLCIRTNATSSTTALPLLPPDIVHPPVLAV